jgi:transcriptional regulator with XRE-family HTH domain
VNLGRQLRRHRKKKGLTLKVVAERTGLSEGFLSQVENNVKSPSVENLVNICQALGVGAGDLLNQAANHQRVYLVGAREWGEVDLPHTGFATRRFMPPGERTALDSAVIFLEPGRSIPVRKDLKKNSQEILCVLKGSLELIHPQRTVRLEAGDAVHFWSEPRDQRIVNQGTELAVALWAGTL